MNIPITKTARQYGYLIWNSKLDMDIEKILGELSSVPILFNDFFLGEKRIDKKYRRISLGYKLTRALKESHDTFSISYLNGVLEVITFDGKK